MADRVPPIPTRAHEYVGPSENGRREDISHYELRPLIVRTLDEVLHVKQTVTLLAGGLRLDLEDKEQRLQALESKVRSDPPPYRDPESSWHEFDPAVKALRATLSRRSKDQTTFNGREAAALVEDFDKAIGERRELAVWRAIKTGARAVTWETLKYTVPAAVIGAAAYVWHWLTTLHH